MAGLEAVAEQGIAGCEVGAVPATSKSRRPGFSSRVAPDLRS